jgi:hypothetical protein
MWFSNSKKHIKPSLVYLGGSFSLSLFHCSSLRLFLLISPFIISPTLHSSFILILDWERKMNFLVVEPDYLPDSKVCFNRAWTPFSNGGLWGDFPPNNSLQGVQGGGRQLCIPPMAGNSGKVPSKRNIGKI